MATIRVPASTSNLGAGFDAFGLALKLYLEVRVELREADAVDCVCVDVEGEGEGELPRTADNLICRAFRLAAEREGVRPPPVAFRVRNEIPLARGLGSSAAAAVAGFSALEAATGRTLPPERLLAYGLEMEG